MQRVKILFVVVLVVIAGAVGWNYTQRSPDPVLLTVAAGPKGGDSHTLLSEVAEVLERHSDSVRIEVHSSKNSSTNISFVNSGKFDMATISSATPTAASVRLIADLFPDYFILITRADSNITRLTDLTGHSIAVPEDGSSDSLAFWSTVDHYDIPTGAFSFHATNLETGTKLFLSGKVDAIFMLKSLRDANMLKLIEDAGLKQLALRFVPIDQADAIALKRPFISSGTVVRGAFDGNPVLPRFDVNTATLHRLLVANSSIEDAPIREITRILFEHRLDLLTRIPLAASIIGARMERGATLPYHDGATSYYNRDEPSFLQENAEPIALLITIAAMMASGLLALRSRFSSTQKNRLDSYNYQLLDIADKVRAANNQGDLKNLREELFSVLETVVRALDTDDVTEEGFQSFSFLWESVRETINDRKTELE